MELSQAGAVQSCRIRLMGREGVKLCWSFGTEIQDRGDSVGPPEPELDCGADLIPLSATINNRHT